LIDALIILALALALIHFGFPLLYYLYLRSRWLNRSWDLVRDPSYRPKVTIVVPTYNEAGLIMRKLDDIASQDYPRELVEVIVVDSASTDGTPSIVRGWAESRWGARWGVAQLDKALEVQPYLRFKHIYA
jgi:cellulose synthase/poly-beta-1,6-N-acetylglucosamine synthase-like glycosyltransferase